MTKTEYAQYIQSEDWQRRRKGFIARAGNRCEQCDLPRWVARLIYDQDLHVHHLNYQSLENERDEDLEVLCRRCHEIETFGRSDFREIKKAECSICHTDHFNIYSDYCNTCQLILEDREDSVLWRLDRKVGGQPLWVDLIYGAIVSYQVSITDLAVVVDRAIQKMDADYEDFLAFKESRPELTKKEEEAIPF